MIHKTFSGWVRFYDRALSCYKTLLVYLTKGFSLYYILESYILRGNGRLWGHQYLAQDILDHVLDDTDSFSSSDWSTEWPCPHLRWPPHMHPGTSNSDKEHPTHSKGTPDSFSVSCPLKLEILTERRYRRYKCLVWNVKNTTFRGKLFQGAFKITVYCQTSFTYIIRAFVPYRWRTLYELYGIMYLNYSKRTFVSLIIYKWWLFV